MDAAAVTMDRGDLGIVAEPARLQVQPGQFGVHDRKNRVEVLQRPGHQPGGRAQGVAVGDGDPA
jgi:hypothetical protein